KYEVDLNGLTLCNVDGPALNLQSNKRAYVVLVDGTENTISDGASYAVSSEDQKGAVFANGKLLFSGAGELNVTGNCKHAVASDDYICTRRGVVMNLTANVSDALHANDGLYLRGGTLTLKAAGNGMEVDKGSINISGGNIYITSENDAVKTSYAATDIDRSIRITGGKVAMITSGAKGHGLNSQDSILITSGVVRAYTYGQGAKGMKAVGNCVVRGGVVTLCTTGAAYYDTTDKDVASATGIKAANFYCNNGTVRIATSGRGAKGIKVDDYFTMNGGYVYVSTSGSSYSYNGDYTYSKGVRAEGVVNICAGDLVIAATGSEGSEGLESKSTVNISGGWVVVKSYDDAINAASAINISGGNVYAYATNNDGIDSNGTILISGGVVVGIGSTSPEEGIDVDNNSNFSITGGTVVGIGGKGMNCYPQGSQTSQYTVFYAGSGLSSGTAIQLTDGTESLLLLKTLRAYSSDFGLLFSSPDMKAGTTYKLNTGGTISGGTELYGYYTGGTYSGGSQIGSFSITSGYVYSNSTGGNQGGGRPGTGGGPTDPGGHGGFGGRGGF
ncbi:MAG: carbohydrate-binding domain-containing protein, partial [Paludibacteraceae bacterium]|nr:carbohydrate-binding domain-containing protein [Paludibacteraceae bacterium]